MKEGNASFFLYLKMIVLTLCTALALTMNFSPSDAAAFGAWTIYTELLNGFGGTSFLTTLLWGVFLYFSIKAKELRTTHIFMMFPVSMILAVVWVMGQSFQIDNTLNALYCSYVQIFKTIIYVIGITNLLYRIGCLLKLLLDKAAYKQNPMFKTNHFVLHLYRKHTFAASMALLADGKGRFSWSGAWK